MRKAETNLQSKMLLEVSQAQVGANLMRNNNGYAVYRNQDGSERHVRYGLGNGTGDLIGYVKRKITPDMVGRTIAIFVSWETKTTDGHEDVDQVKFRKKVIEDGGIAFVARSGKEAIECLNDK